MKTVELMNNENKTILEEIKQKIPKREERLGKTNFFNIKKEFEEKIARYEDCIFPRNIILTVTARDNFNNITIPHIKELVNKIRESNHKLEELILKFENLEKSEKRSFTKLLTAVKVMEDVSIEMNKDIDIIVKNLKIDGKIVLMSMNGILLIFQLFELIDICIDEGHEILRYNSFIEKLADKYEKNKVKENFIEFLEMIHKHNFPAIRKGISEIEKDFLQKNVIFYKINID